MEMKKVVMTTENYNEQMTELKRKIASSGCCLSHPFLDGSSIAMGYCIEPVKSPTRMPKETTTYLYVDGSVRVATYRDGCRYNDVSLIPAIEDVQVLNDKVVMVKFADGTSEKAVLDVSDTFSIEQGVSICLSKKVLSTLTKGNGGSVYNKLVEYGMKTYEAIEAHKVEVAKEKTEKAAKEKRDAEKAQRKRERKATEQREAEIEIQKEAYLRAMRELNEDK